MKNIEEQIKWYEENATRKDDDLIQENLKLIGQLYGKIENSEDRIFLDKIIATFCEIMEVQRGVIQELSTEAEENALFTSTPNGHGFVALYPTPVGSDDDQLQEAFISYCLSSGKSSYTANDYCSRLKNLWKKFYADYQKENGCLPQQLSKKLPDILWDSVLSNVHDHTDLLKEYIGLKMTEGSDSRNWLNARAALNKFDKFKSVMK